MHTTDSATSGTVVSPRDAPLPRLFDEWDQVQRFHVLMLLAGALGTLEGVRKATGTDACNNMIDQLDRALSLHKVTPRADKP